MSSESRPRTIVAAGGVASAMLAFETVVHLTHTVQDASDLRAAVEYLQLASLIVTLAALMRLVQHLRLLGAGAGAVRAALAGMAVLAALCTSSLLNGGDFGFFPPVAIASNLVWLGGLVAMAVGLVRDGRLGRAYAIGLPVTWIFTLPLSAIGGGVVAAAYWLALAWRLVGRPRAVAVA